MELAPRAEHRLGQSETQSETQIDDTESQSWRSVLNTADCAAASSIMAMCWILTWKEAPEGTKATARLVAKGFTDPDLQTIRADAPTLSNIGSHCLFQMACSHKFKLEV